MKLLFKFYGNKEKMKRLGVVLAGLALIVALFSTSFAQNFAPGITTPPVDYRIWPISFVLAHVAYESGLTLQVVIYADNSDEKLMQNYVLEIGLEGAPRPLLISWAAVAERNAEGRPTKVLIRSYILNNYRYDLLSEGLEDFNSPISPVDAR